MFVCSEPRHRLACSQCYHPTSKVSETLYSRCSFSDCVSYAGVDVSARIARCHQRSNLPALFILFLTICDRIQIPFIILYSILFVNLLYTNNSFFFLFLSLFFDACLPKLRASWKGKLNRVFGVVRNCRQETQREGTTKKKKKTNDSYKN